MSENTNTIADSTLQDTYVDKFADFKDWPVNWQVVYQLVKLGNKALFSSSTLQKSLGLDSYDAISATIFRYSKTGAYVKHKRTRPYIYQILDVNILQKILINWLDRFELAKLGSGEIMQTEFEFHANSDEPPTEEPTKNGKYTRVEIRLESPTSLEIVVISDHEAWEFIEEGIALQKSKNVTANVLSKLSDEELARELNRRQKVNL